MNTFGQVIPPLGPNYGFPGNVSRVGERVVSAKQVAPSGIPINFGDGVIVVRNSTTGFFRSLADYLATPANAATLPADFAGVAMREVKQSNLYTAYSQVGNTSTVATTTTAAAAAGTNVLAVTSAAGLAIGQTVEGIGVQSGSSILSIAALNVTISKNLVGQGIPSGGAVTFTSVNSPAVGTYAPGQMCEALERGSITVPCMNGSPLAGGPVYIRTAANAALPGTFIGGFEAAADGTNSVILGATNDPWIVFRIGGVDANGMAEITIKSRHAA